MAPKSHSKSTKRFSATHHGISLVLLDIDASKKDAGHLDYKYRDQASRIRAIELLIQQYALKVSSKDGEYKDSEPEKLYNAMRNVAKTHLTFGGSPAENERILFQTGSERVNVQYLESKLRTHHEFAKSHGLAKYDESMVITLSSDVEAALASEPHYERVKSEASEDLLSDPPTTKHKRKRTAASPSSDVVAPEVKRLSRAQARSLSSSPVSVHSPVIISSSGAAQSWSPVSTTPAPPTSLLPSPPLARHPCRLRINVKSRTVQGITSTPSTSSSSLHDTTEISQQMVDISTLVHESMTGLFGRIKLGLDIDFTYEEDCDQELAAVFCLCWGDDWKTALEDLRSLKVLKALDTMIALIAGAIFLEILADDCLQVSLCQRAGTLPEDDYREAFHLLASHDLSRQQQGKWLARPMLNKMLRRTDAGQGVLHAFTGTVTSKLVDVFTPQVEVLVNVSHALNPRRKSDPSREWKASFVADMLAIVSKALHLKLEVTEKANEHQFFWPAYGDVFDKQIHSARGLEKERVALALSAGLRTFTDDQPSPVQIGLVDVLTQSNIGADTASSQVSPEFSPLSQR